MRLYKDAFKTKSFIITSVLYYTYNRCIKVEGVVKNKITNTANKFIKKNLKVSHLFFYWMFSHINSIGSDISYIL